MRPNSTTCWDLPLAWDACPSADRDERWRRQVRATYMLCVLRDPPDRIAAFFGVSRRTIYHWRDEVLDSGRSEVKRLRELIECREGR